MADFSNTFLNDAVSAESTRTHTTITSSSPSTSNMQLIYDELKKLNKNVQDLNQRMEKLEAEIISLRKVSGNKPRMLLPPIPFQKTDDIDQFEDELNTSSELCEQLEAEILNYNIADPAKFVRTILKKIFSDEAATNYSWKGTVAKKCILGMKITTMLKGAFNQKFAVDENKFSAICSKWFQTATDRIKYYKKSRK